MKRTFIIAGIAACCLLNQIKTSFAVGKNSKLPLATEKLTYASLINKAFIDNYSGYYNNATSNQIQVWFMAPGIHSHPQSVVFFDANNHSGTFNVVAGTYDLQFFSPSNISVTIVGTGQSGSGSNPIISNVNCSGSPLTINIYSM